MKQKIKLTEIERKKILRNTLIISILIIVVIAGLCVANILKKEKLDKSEFSAVNQICELATLKCYYHDVAEYEKQPDGLFKYGLFKYGYKKFWIEYDGIVDIGIDAGQVQVNMPDKEGVVKIYVPEAKILNVYENPESMSEVVTDTGIFTKITTSERAEAFSKAQETMRSNAENDTNILIQAHNNAKKLLEEYVVRIGKQKNIRYTVEWINEPMGNVTQEKD